MDDYDLLLDYISDEPIQINDTRGICCGDKMIQLNDYEVICKVCARVEEYVIPSITYIRQKQYDRRVYFRKHLYLILCKSSIKSYPHIDAVMKREKFINSIYKVRDILYKNKLQKYNILAPMLLYRYGNVEAPLYNGSEIRAICEIYARIEYLFFNNCRTKRNSVFYSFLIFKIIQALYDDSRLLLLTKFIYFSNFNTIHKSLEFWENIRKELKLPKKCGYIIN